MCRSSHSLLFLLHHQLEQISTPLLQKKKVLLFNNQFQTVSQHQKKNAALLLPQLQTNSAPVLLPVSPPEKLLCFHSCRTILHIYHIFPTRERISYTTTFSWKTWWEFLLKLELALPGLQYKTTPYKGFLIMGSFRGTPQRLFRYVCNLGPRLVCLNYYDGKL